LLLLPLPPAAIVLLNCDAVNQTSFFQSRWMLAGARFLTLLGLAVWLGGLAFVGVAAPAVFELNRALGPQAVGAMLARFTPMMYGCGALMLLGWALERLRRGEIHSANERLWWAQGIGTAAMLIITLYLGRAVMPEINATQPPRSSVAARTQAAPPRTNAPTPTAKTLKARFDAAHERYTQLTKVTVLLGMATLLLLCLRLSVPYPGYESPDHLASATQESIFVSATLR
jgi:hypothetical protein